MKLITFEQVRGMGPFVSAEVQVSLQNRKSKLYLFRADGSYVYVEFDIPLGTESVGHEVMEMMMACKDLELLNDAAVVKILDLDTLGQQGLVQ